MPDSNPDEIPLRVKWRRTRPERANDFVAVNPDGTIGQIYLRNTGALLQGQWLWFYGAANGTEPTARQAAKGKPPVRTVLSADGDRRKS